MNKCQYVFVEYGLLLGVGLMCIGFFLGVMGGIFFGIGLVVMMLAVVIVHGAEWDIDFYKLETGEYVGRKKMSVRNAMDHSHKNGYAWRYHKGWRCSSSECTGYLSFK